MYMAKAAGLIFLVSAKQVLFSIPQYIMDLPFLFADSAKC